MIMTQISRIIVILGGIGIIAGLAIMIASESKSERSGNLSKIGVRIVDGKLFGVVPSPVSAGAHTQEPPDRPMPQREDVARHAALLIENSPSIRHVRDTMSAEVRDERWAGMAESDLRASFLEMTGVGKDSRFLNIRCASATCEVMGELPPTSPDGDAMKEMQSPDLVKSMDDRGYRMSNMGFVPSALTGKEIFLAYYKRGPAR